MTSEKPFSKLVALDRFPTETLTNKEVLTMRHIPKAFFWTILGISTLNAGNAWSEERVLNQYPRTEVVSAAPEFPKVQNAQDEEMARRFSWWPSDAQPAPYKDQERSGFWWWPSQPGQNPTTAWGNQGWVYVRKVIFDYKSEPGPMKSSLVIKKIIKNVRVYFDYDKSTIRSDAQEILDQAMGTMDRNPNADILITGNADVRGSEQYNLKLGERRGEAVKEYLIAAGLPEDRIKILSRGKLDALATKGDLVGMQKDRNAQFMIAEVEEIQIPADQAASMGEVVDSGARVVQEEKQLEGSVKVDVKEYVIQKGDTLWAIAKREYGDGRQWNRIYEFNRDVISNPNRPKRGTTIRIPIE